MASPNPYPTVNIDSARLLMTGTSGEVGPSLYRDEVDARMVQELNSLGTLGQIVFEEEGLYPGYPGCSVATTTDGY